MHQCIQMQLDLDSKSSCFPDIAGTFCNHAGLSSSASAPLLKLSQDRISMRITSESPVPAPIAADSCLVRVTLT